MWSLILLLVALPASAKRPAPPVAPNRPAAPVALTPAELALVDATASVAATPIQYLFLLDTAGPQLAIAQAARADIARIVRALPAGDSVAVTVYHTRPSSTLPSTKVEDANREDLAKKIEGLELTSARDSDLGAGLAYAANQIGRSGAAPRTYVFMMGSFCHSPSMGSDYDTGGRGCRAIRGVDKLEAAVAATRADRIVAATLFPVAAPPDFPVDPAGIAATEAVFPAAARVDLSTTSFSTWAANYAHRIRFERIAPLVRADAAAAHLSATVEQEPTVEKPVARVRISGGTRFVTTRLTDVHVEGTRDGSFPAELTLAPDTTLELPLLVKTSFSILPHTETLTFPFSVSGNLSLEPVEGVRSLGLEPIRAGQRASGSASIAVSTGYLGLLGVVLGLLVVVAGGYFGLAYTRRRLQRLKLGGSFSYRREGGPRQALDIAEQAEARIGLGPDGTLAADGGTRPILTLRMVREGTSSHAEVEIHSEGVEMNRKPVPRGRHRITPGTTSFQFAGYRLSWE